MMSFSQLSTPAYTSSGITTPFAVTAEARSSTIGLMSQPDVITSPPVVRTTANTVEQQTTAPRPIGYDPYNYSRYRYTDHRYSHYRCYHHFSVPVVAKKEAAEKLQ